MKTVKDRAIAVIYKDNQILMMWRYRDNQEFHVFPGGTQEENETIEETLIREVYEELNLKVNKHKRIYEWVHEYDEKSEHYSRKEYYYLITDFAGEIKMGAPELFRQNQNNIYRPDWINLDEVDKIDYEPREIFEVIQKEVNEL